MKIQDLKANKIKSIVLEEVEFQNNERIEILIFLANYIGIEDECNKYYLLLGGRELICRRKFTNKDYMIENARKLLKTLNQKKVYLDALDDYDEDEDEENIYVKKNNRYVLKDNLNSDVIEKEKLYYKLLNLEITYRRHKTNYAFQDNKRYGISINDRPIEIKIPSFIKPHEIEMPKKRNNKKLKVKIDDLIEEAKLFDEVLSNNDGYRSNILTNNKFKIIKNSKISNTKTIEFSELTNIVGQVGAGKSTFSDTVVKNLVKDNNKILIIQPSVNKVLEKCEELNKLGIKSESIIGKNSWNTHIEKAIDGKDYLNEYKSKILTSACIIGGLINEADVTIKYGEEPCNKIYKFYEKGDKNQLKKDKRFTCPYYYICPRTESYKKIVGADVLVTTSAGLSSISIGISGMTLFQYALEYINLIIVDEAESELNKLDQIFAPIVAYDDYVIGNSDLIGNYYSEKVEHRNSKKENIKFNNFYIETERAFTKIYGLIKGDKQGFSISTLKRPFTVKALINMCEDKKWIPTSICKYLSKVIGDNRYKWQLRELFEFNRKKELIEYFEEIQSHQQMLNRKKSEKLENEIYDDLSRRQVRMIIFIVAVLYFESNYRGTSNLVEGNDNLPNSTKAILSQRFEFQQKYIPVSPMGNIFALQYKDDEKHSDLFIVKQFALGRSMYLRFPWFKLNLEGKGNGLNVLLLSGSSFAKGSFSGHINENVNYIIEAEEYKRKFISESYFEFYDTGVIVSGSKEEKRKENLRKLISNCKELILDELDDNNNILMIVNSYEDAEIVYKKLIEIFDNTDYKNLIGYLVPDDNNEEMEASIKYSNVHKFNGTGFKILISAAILIERGHNIVDSNGNSAFDTLMFLTRPMSNPNDFNNHVSKVNGHIMSKYSNKNYGIDLNVFAEMIKEAGKMYNELKNENYRLADIPEVYQKDVVVTLFIMILQIFGRLCRIGNEENKKDKAPKVYFLDAAFKSSDEEGFDLLNRLVDYLEELMAEEGIVKEISKTLYESFYIALKRGKNIYG